MGIGDWDIFGELARLRRDLSRLSRGVFPDLRQGEPEEPWAPAVDILEEEGALVLVVDLPGVKREDIELIVDRESVTVEGQRAGHESGAGIRLERPIGRFRRSFKMMSPVDPGGAQAVQQDGVLRVTVPQAAPAGPGRVRVRVE